MSVESNSDTNISCHVCRYRVVHFSCGHEQLESLAPLQGSGLSKCEYFRVDRKGFGYCLRNPNPTDENVILSQIHSETYSNNLCCAIQCFKELVDDLNMEYHEFSVEYAYVAKTLFNTPGLRHVVKLLPNEHKSVLKYYIFSAGPDLNQEWFHLRVRRDQCNDLVYNLEQTARIVANQTGVEYNPEQRPQDDQIYEMIESIVDRTILAAIAPSKMMIGVIDLLQKALEVFSDEILESIEEAGGKLSETFTESSQRWEKAKDWLRYAYWQNKSEDEIEKLAQVWFDQWGVPPFYHVEEAFVGAAAFYLNARPPVQRKDGDCAIQRTEVGYWEEFGTFDSIASSEWSDGFAEREASRGIAEEEASGETAQSRSTGYYWAEFEAWSRRVMPVIEPR